MKKNLILTGIFGGIKGGVFFILFFLTIYFIYDNPFLPDPKSLDFFVYLLSVFGVLLFYRFRIAEERPSYWQALFLGVLIVSMMVFTACIFLYIFLTYIAPETIQLYVDNLLTQLSNPEIDKEAYGGEAQFNQMIADLKATNKWDLIFLEMRQKLVISFAMTLIGAAIIRLV